MADPSSRTRSAEANAAIGFLDASLRGAGQVIFQDNALSGLAFLAAVAWGAVRSGAPEVAVGAVLALVVATMTAMLIKADAAALRQGLFGFNGLLVGAGVPTFLAATPAMWLLLVAGAAVSTVAMLAVGRVMRTWGVPALTFPFVLTTWFLLLAAYAFGAVTIDGMGPPAFAVPPAPAAAEAATVPLLAAWLTGPAQVFFIDDWLSGALVVLGLAVASLWAAAFALLGSGVALVVALALGADSGDVAHGLYGFSPVLTAVALGCTFRAPSWRAGLYALLATVFTVIVQAALNVGLAPLGIPALTAPFVVVTWLFLLARRD